MHSGICRSRRRASNGLPTSMRTCSQKNTGEHLGPTEGLHTRAVCLRHLLLESFLTGSGCRRHVRVTPIATVLWTSLELRFVPRTEVASYSIYSAARVSHVRGTLSRAPS